jgi:transposase
MARTTLTGFRQFVEGCAGEDVWIGVDVHKHSYHACFRRADGHKCTFVCPADPQDFVRRISQAGMNVLAVAYEAGPTGFPLARAVEAAGMRAIVAAPNRIPRSVSAGAKTDRLDCIRLAEYAARGLLRPIAVPSQTEEAERLLLRRRHQVTDSLRRVKQRIKSLLLCLGIAEPAGLTSWSKIAVATLQALPLMPSARETMDSHLRELTFQHDELREVEKKLAELVEQAEHEEVVRCLRSVQGVGPVVATTYHLELFRPERFGRGEEVASYLGLAPMVRHSGEKTPRGRLVPVGQTRLRSLLIEAAWIWKTRDAWARGLYNRILGRTGLAQKAITAVARRLAIILWRISVEKRPYRPQLA